MCKEKDGRYENVTKLLIDLKKVYIGTQVSYPDNSVNDDTVFIDRIMRDKRTEREAKPEEAHTAEETDGGRKKKPKKKPDKKDRVSVIAGTITGALLFCVLAFVFYSFFFNKVPEIELPDFKGKTVSEAEELVRETQLKIVVDGEEKSDELEAGQIISQQPTYGKMVKENATIKVVISLGGEDAKMPDLKDMSEENAKKLLDSLSIKFESVAEESSTTAAGYVLRQHPSYGTKMKPTDTATIYVSKEESAALVPVPNLIGMTKDAAVNALQSAKLTPGVIYKESSTRPEGTVAKQSLKANIQVAQGTTVDIIISTGSGAATQPPAQNTPQPTREPSPATKEPLVPVPNTLE